MSQSIDSLFEGIEPVELLKEIDRCEYEEDFYKFFKAGWRYIDPSLFADGVPLECVADHLQAVARGEIKRLIVNIPPRMSKSSLCSVSFPAWVWAQRRESPTSGPGTQFLHASYSQSLSLRDSVKCRRLIESPWYKQLWGDRFVLTSDQNTKTRFDNSRTGSRLCTSVGSTLTGEGGNIIIVDDPNAAQEAFSEATISTTIEWWDTALSTRLNDARNGAFVVIQQRLAEDDLTGHILSKSVGEWQHVMLPMRYEPERSFHTSIGWEDWRSEPGELLWPERFGEDEVVQLERTLGPYGAAGQLQQRPSVKGGGIIKRDWWQLWEQDQFPSMSYIVASLDTAYTTKQENDFSAMTIWGVFTDMPDTMANNFASANHHGEKSGSSSLVNYKTAAARFDEAAQIKLRSSLIESAPKVVMLWAWQERMELHELVEKVASSCSRFRVDTLLIESKAAGISVAQELRRLYSNEDFGVQLLDPGSQDKVSRLYSVQHLFSDGIIYAPDRRWADEVITQIEMFPKAKNDDLVDTVSQAMRYLRTTGVLQRQDEVRRDIEQSMRHTNGAAEPLYPA